MRILAVVLAGGEGNRLKALSKDCAKPALPFSGQCKIIDFTLNNLKDSGIQDVSVCLQYKPESLQEHLEANSWGFDSITTLIGGVTTDYYSGTADALFDNIAHIDGYQPDAVMILNADHVYQMDYQKMMDMHIETQSDFTIGYVDVPKEDTYRYGILELDTQNKITMYQEKPDVTDSTCASMGLYIAKWDVLKQYLITDAHDSTSRHDLGYNIVSKILNDGYKMYGYHFNGYWQDVGTVESYWLSNLDMLESDLMDDVTPKYLNIEGCVINSVIHSGVTVGQNSEVKHAVVHPNVSIGRDVQLSYAIVTRGVTIPDHIQIHGSEEHIVIIDDVYLKEI